MLLRHQSVGRHSTSKARTSEKYCQQLAELWEPIRMRAQTGLYISGAQKMCLMFGWTSAITYPMTQMPEVGNDFKCEF